MMEGDEVEDYEKENEVEVEVDEVEVDSDEMLRRMISSGSVRDQPD